MPRRINPMDFAARLYKGGFNSQEAGDIMVWMCEPMKWPDYLDALIAMEDYYRQADTLYMAGPKYKQYQDISV